MSRRRLLSVLAAVAGAALLAVLLWAAHPGRVLAHPDRTGSGARRTPSMPAP